MEALHGSIHSLQEPILSHHAYDHLKITAALSLGCSVMLGVDWAMVNVGRFPERRKLPTFANDAPAPQWCTKAWDSQQDTAGGAPPNQLQCLG